MVSLEKKLTSSFEGPTVDPETEIGAAEEQAMRMGGNDSERNQFESIRILLKRGLITATQAIARAWAIVSRKSSGYH